MTEDSNVAQDPYSKPARARKSRVLAVQAIYQSELNDSDIGEIFEHYKQDHLTGAKGRQLDKKLFESVLRFLKMYPEVVENSLKECLQPKWTFERLEMVLRAILKVASAEAHLKCTPVPVLINEYVQVTNGFFDRDEDKLVNGVLDCLTKKIA